MTLPEPAIADAQSRVTTDVAIIGAGVAGLFTATKLPDGLDVVVVDKGVPGRSGSSPWAQGGLAAALGPDDEPSLHAADTVRAGDGLSDAAAVRVLAEEAPGCVRDLIGMGAGFDELDDGSGRLHLAREGGQSRARSVHRADATGAEMVRALRTAAAPRVRRLAGTALELVVVPTGRVTGVWVLGPEGDVILLSARAVLLATGGCGGLFAATTNQDHATGDGIALAYRAGATVRDLEFVQFHPTGLAVAGSWRFLLTEALRGAGATLHRADGTRFMPALHPDAELAPRHVVAKAILDQPDGAWLDATHLGADVLATEFPTVVAGARNHGFDLATERVPVTPAAHYMVGGVGTDLHGRASRPGLYAAGEVASTGVHGANRMAGNSLSEALVFGARAATVIAAELADPATTVPAEPELSGNHHAPAELSDLRAELRETMWTGVGPVRDGAGMAAALHDLQRLAARLGPVSTDPDHAELAAAITAAQLIATSARLRTESRGGHWRTDHPQRSAAWRDVHLERSLPGA